MAKHGDWANQCIGCIFADKDKLARWLKNEETPYCTNAFRRLDFDEKNKAYCASKRRE